MPSGKKRPKIKWTTDRLQKYDDQHGLSKKAHGMVRPDYWRHGHWTEKDIMRDHGRTLAYYEPIHRLVETYSKGKLRGLRLLHIASATGIYTQFLQSRGVQAVGLDLNNEILGIAKAIKNRRLVHGDAQQLPFKTNSFDFVLTDNFLFSNYMAEEMPVLGEFRRVLKPDGIAILYKVYEEKFDLKEIEQQGFKLLKKAVVPSYEAGVQDLVNWLFGEQTLFYLVLKKTGR